MQPSYATTWEEADLWTWPTDPDGATDPHLLGYWAPLDVTTDVGPLLYGVHAALLYDGQYERLMLMRNDAIVYDLENAGEAGCSTSMERRPLPWSGRRMVTRSSAPGTFR